VIESMGAILASIPSYPVVAALEMCPFMIRQRDARSSGVGPGNIVVGLQLKYERLLAFRPWGAAR